MFHARRIAGTVEEVSPSGTLSQSGLYDGLLDSPSPLAIDQTGDVVVSSNAPGDSSILKANGSTVIFQHNYGSVATAQSVAIMADNNIVATDTLEHIVYSLSGTTGLTDIASIKSMLKSGENPTGRPALAANGDIWVQSSNGTRYHFVGGLPSSSTSTTSATITGGQIGFDNASNGYAIGTAINADETFSVVFNTSSGFDQQSFGGFTGTSPSAIAVDGAAHLWIVSNDGDARVYYLPSINGALFPLMSSPDGTADPVSAIATDGSGNVWLTSAGSGGLTEIVGAAAPVVTPLVSAALEGFPLP